MQSAVSDPPEEDYFLSTNLCHLATVMKGTGALALKASAVRRRTKAEVREAKLEEAARAADVEKKLRELEQLKAAHNENQTAMNNATNIMHQLYDQGLLKQTEEDGKVVPVETFEEYQQLREMK